MLGGAIAGLGARPNPFATAATTTNTKPYQARFFSARSSSFREVVSIMHASWGWLAFGPFWHLATWKSDLVEYVRIEINENASLHALLQSYAYVIALSLTRLEMSGYLPVKRMVIIPSTKPSFFHGKRDIDKVPDHVGQEITHYFHFQRFHNVKKLNIH